jgi:hypothetical protein
MEEFAYSFLANSKETWREGSRLMSRWLISFHSPSRAYCLVRISKVPSTTRMGSDWLRVYFFINIIFSALQSRLIFNYITE